MQLKPKAETANRRTKLSILHNTSFLISNPMVNFPLILGLREGLGRSN